MLCLCFYALICTKSDSKVRLHVQCQNRAFGGLRKSTENYIFRKQNNEYYTWKRLENIRFT